MKSQALVTGISDFHTLTVNIMRNPFLKGNPQTKFYKDFKNFDREIFEIELKYSLQSFQWSDFAHFGNVFLLLLNKYAPIKEKVLWKNHNSSMKKILHKIMMLRSQLKNNFFKF